MTVMIMPQHREANKSWELLLSQWALDCCSNKLCYIQ